MDERGWRPDWRTRLAEYLRDHGAHDDAAVGIVEALEEAGLSVTEARAWLSERAGQYPANAVWTPEWAWRQVPIHAIEDGHASLVLEEARRFAAATSEERLVARALGRDIDAVRVITGGEQERTRTVAEIVRALRDRLGSAERVSEVLYMERRNDRLDRSDRRLLDEIIDGDERDVLQRLVAGEIDLEKRLADGIRDSVIPGIVEWNPYWPPREAPGTSGAASV